MNTTRINEAGGRKTRFRSGGVPVTLAILLIGSALEGIGDDQKLDVLATSKATYTNVTVTGKSAVNVFIQHNGGVVNIKVDDLAPDSRQALGFAPLESGKKMTFIGSDSITSNAASRVAEAVSVERLESLTGWKLPAGIPEIRLNPSMVAGALTGVLLCYLFVCYCFALICRKAGREPGALVWIPILQLFPLLRAAGMSGWWFLAFCVPGVNLVAHIFWSVNIVRARDKSVWWVILMVLPLTNLLAILHLAFSGTAASSAAENRVQVTSPQPA